MPASTIMTIKSVSSIMVADVPMPAQTNQEHLLPRCDDCGELAFWHSRLGYWHKCDPAKVIARKAWRDQVSPADVPAGE